MLTIRLQAVDKIPHEKWSYAIGTDAVSLGWLTSQILNIRARYAPPSLRTERHSWRSETHRETSRETSREAL
jgi:hypothetical protein